MTKIPKYRPPPEGSEQTKFDTGGLKITPKVMQVAGPLCAECPLRRDSQPGALGGYNAEMYMSVMLSPASVACHKSAGFRTGEIERQHHCRGIAAFRANIGHVCRVGQTTTNAHTSTQAVGSDSVTYFATVDEFMEHHTSHLKEK